MVYLRLVFDERVYILNGCSSPYSITEIDNGNAMIDALPYPVAVRTLKCAVKDGVVNPTVRLSTP